MGKWSFTDVKFSDEHNAVVESVQQMPIEEVISLFHVVSCGYDVGAVMESLGLAVYNGSSGGGWACIDNSAAKHYDYTKQPIRLCFDYQDMSSQEALKTHYYRACVIAKRLGIPTKPTGTLSQQDLLQRIILLASVGDVDQKTEALKALHDYLGLGDLDLTMGILFKCLFYGATIDDHDKVFSSYKEIVPKLKEQCDIEKLASHQDTSYVVASFLFEEDKEKKDYWWKVLEAKNETHRLMPCSQENPQGFCLDTLIALVEKGPVWDGDIPSKAGRDSLIDLAAAARVIVKGEDGFTAATYLGRELYKFHYGKADTIDEAMTNRITQRTIRRMSEG